MEQKEDAWRVVDAQMLPSWIINLEIKLERTILENTSRQD
jgi:hypothetical protein